VTFLATDFMFGMRGHFPIADGAGGDLSVFVAGNASFGFRAH
jgi:hypothetical protein